MANCKRPMPMYMGINGKATLFIKQAQRPLVKMYDVDCGRCINCRIKKSGEISSRVLLECRVVDEICDKMKYPLICRPLFLTLTYDDEHLPVDEKVNKEHLKKFLVDLKKLMPVRYIACGEYGGKTTRPHYHVIIWSSNYFESCDFEFTKIDNTSGAYACYSCPRIEGLWKYGQMRINLCVPETISYVAGYVLKKMTGLLEKVKFITRYGEESERDSGFFLYSLRPGVGALISESVCRQLLRDGYINYRGNKLALPRYIKIVLARRFPCEYDVMIERLISEASKKDVAVNPESFEGWQSDRARSKIAEKLTALKSDVNKF